MSHFYRIVGDMERPGDASIETIGLLNAKAAFADMIVEGARFASLIEVTDGHERVIGQYGCVPTQ
jgi:hypothetical protein